MQSMVRNWLIKSIIKILAWQKCEHLSNSLKSSIPLQVSNIKQLLLQMHYTWWLWSFFSYIKKTKVPQVKCITSFPPKNAISCIVLYHPCKNNMTLLFQPISIYCLIENCSSFLSFVNWCEISFSLDAF